MLTSLIDIHYTMNTSRWVSRPTFLVVLMPPLLPPSGYPEGHPNRISRVDSIDELTADEKLRAGPIRGEATAAK